jgi:hypothetical protein
MKNHTSPEQAQAMQQAYRSRCTHRRRGHIIDRLEDGQWKVEKDFSSKSDKGFNAAKPYSRQNLGVGRVYVEF